MKILPEDSIDAMDFVRTALKGTDWEIKCQVWINLTNPSNTPSPFRAIEDVDCIIEGCGMTTKDISYTNNDDEVPIIDVTITKLILGEWPTRQILQCLGRLEDRMSENDRIDRMKILHIKMVRSES